MENRNGMDLRPLQMTQAGAASIQGASSTGAGSTGEQDIVMRSSADGAWNTDSADRKGSAFTAVNDTAVSTEEGAAAGTEKTEGAMQDTVTETEQSLGMYAGVQDAEAYAAGAYAAGAYATGTDATGAYATGTYAAGEQDAGMQAVSPKKRTLGQRFADYFSATRIAYIAIFTAVSYVLCLFDFPVLGAVPFLKIDFSNVFVMITGFSLGPVAGVIVAVLKELLHAITFGQTAFVGELANVLMVLPYMLIPAIVYRKHKGIKVVILTLILGCVAQCIVCIPVNYLLNFPAYLMAYTGTTWKEGMDYFLDLWYWAVLFNLIKSVIISAATIIIYKPLSKLIKATAAKFEKMKKKKRA